LAANEVGPACRGGTCTPRSRSASGTYVNQPFSLQLSPCFATIRVRRDARFRVRRGKRTRRITSKRGGRTSHEPSYRAGIAGSPDKRRLGERRAAGAGGERGAVDTVEDSGGVAREQSTHWPGGVGGGSAAASSGQRVVLVSKIPQRTGPLLGPADAGSRRQPAARRTGGGAAGLAATATQTARLLGGPGRDRPAGAGGPGPTAPASARWQPQRRALRRDAARRSRVPAPRIAGPLPKARTTRIHRPAIARGGHGGPPGRGVGRFGNERLHRPEDRTDARRGAGDQPRSHAAARAGGSRERPVKTDRAR